MCDLGGWDGALEISGLALADLAVALDQSVRPTVDNYPAANLPGGLVVNLPEQLLNQELLVPRVLYATWNSDFDPGPGSYPGADDDLERLHARLKEYVRLTDSDFDPSGNLRVLGDPGNRLTFVRDQWYNGGSVPLDMVLQPSGDDDDGFVRPNTVRFRLSGKVLIGGNFVDGATVLNSPDALDFSMELDYVVRVGSGSFFPLDQLNVGLGSFPFMTLAPPCGQPDILRLPPLAGRPIWAVNLGTAAQTNPPGTPVGVRWRLPIQNDIDNGLATLFTGAPGDCILDPDTGQERWLVVDTFREPVSFQDPPDAADNLQSMPRRVLVDRTCNGAAAEAGKSFAFLSFDRIFKITISPLVGGLSNAQKFAINNSIMKLDGFQIGAWLDASSLIGVAPPNPQQLALLTLLGPQAMNVAPLPGDLTLPFPPRRFTGDGAPYVESDVIVLKDAATRVFPVANGDSGAIALGGCFSDVIPPADPLPENFTHAVNAANAGQDLAVGLSQRVVDRWLNPVMIEPKLRGTMEEEVEGFDPGAFRVETALGNNRFDIHVSGEGAFDLEIIELPFEFEYDFPLRLRPQPAVARLNAPGTELDGKPVDAAQFALPDDLSCIGMNLARGDFIANTPASNPLCFLAYRDPRVPGGNVLFQPSGPWVRVSGLGGGCPTCTLGSPACPIGPSVPAAYLFREPHFVVPPFPSVFNLSEVSLRPGLELVFVPPNRDEVEVDVDFPWWVDFIVSVVAGPLIGFDPVTTLGVTGALADMLAFNRVYDGLRGGVAGTTPLTANGTLNWQFFLQHSNPLAPSNDAFKIEPSGMCMLFRVLVGPDPRLGNWAAAVSASLGL